MTPASRARRRAAGLCIHCGEAPPAPERQTCDECARVKAEKQRIYAATQEVKATRRTRERKKVEGWRGKRRCRTCGGRKKNEGSRCVRCRNRHRAYEARRPRQRVTPVVAPVASFTIRRYGDMRELRR